MSKNKDNKKILKVAILGSGNIGCDIMQKTILSKNLLCKNLIGRRNESNGINFAKGIGVNTSCDGINEIIMNHNDYDLVFDATSAADHLQHSAILKKLNIKVINLTPAPSGKYCVPAINLAECLKEDNINLITCGGQAAIPLCYALSIMHQLDYLEIVSTISAKSAGLATRQNINEYLCTTEAALQQFTGCRHVKVILNINPAEPCVNMQTTIYAKIKNPDMLGITNEILAMEKRISLYVPGYKLLSHPICDNEKVIIMLQVIGLGHYLPKYAGNLDIITCAAIKVAEEIANNRSN